MVKKTLFLLKGIFHQNVDLKYKFIHPATSSSINDHEESVEDHLKTKRTNISDLTKIESTKAYFTFLDEAKKDHQCIISMYDLVGKKMPTTTEIYCFWCRHGFEGTPVGCPIYYISHRILKKMMTVSNSTKDSCNLRENISKEVFQKIKGNLDHHPIIEQDFYVVDGIFCSFPCCLAFIHDNKPKNPIYRDSEHLLRQMCQSISKSFTPCNLQPAPSWRLLQSFGGHLSIQHFRKGFENTNYIDHKQLIHKMPHQKLVGFLFEKQITL